MVEPTSRLRWLDWLLSAPPRRWLIRPEGPESTLSGRRMWAGVEVIAVPAELSAPARTAFARSSPAHGLSPIPEDLRLPRGSLRHPVDITRIRIGLHHPQLFRCRRAAARQAPSGGAKAVEPFDNGAAFIIEHAEQAGEQFQQSRLFLIRGLIREGADLSSACSIGRPLRHLVNEIGHLRLLSPVVLLHIER